MKKMSLECGGHLRKVIMFPESVQMMSWWRVASTVASDGVIAEFRPVWSSSDWFAAHGI